MEVVNFVCADVLSESFSAPARIYDVVFCRNLLIYLNAAARERLANRLATWVRPDGLLFVGHAEHSGMLRAHFAPLAAPHAFALRPADKSERVAEAERSGDLKPLARRRRRALLQSRQASEPTADGTEPARSTAPIDARPHPASKNTRSIRPEPRPMAGTWNGRMSTLQTLLRRDHPDPMVYELLGNVQLGRQRLDEARVAFEKVLYLLPDHAESLLHLAMICDRQGDARRAARYRQRAARSHRHQRSIDDASSSSAEA